MSPDPTRVGSHEPTVDWNVDDHPPAAQYVLPEIVPATADDVPEAAEVPPTAQPPALDPGLPGRPVARDPNAHQTGVQGVGEYVGPVPTEAAAVALRRPGRRPRVRRVTRVLRHIDPWSAFKVGIIFSAVAYIVALTSGVLLWRVADSTGTLDNVERWFTQFGWETFEFDGEAIFRNARTIGLFGAVALTGAIVLLVTLFNLVSDIVGGVRMTVLEEEVVERTATSSRRFVVRRTPAAAARATGVGEPAWNVEDGPDPLELVAERPPVPAAADWSITRSPAATAGDDDLPDPAAELISGPVDADWSIDDDRADDDGEVDHDEVDHDDDSSRGDASPPPPPPRPPAPARESSSSTVEPDGGANRTPPNGADRNGRATNGNGSTHDRDQVDAAAG